jgi:low affinity Fe/Cu permease
MAETSSGRAKTTRRRRAARQPVRKADETTVLPAFERFSSAVARESGRPVTFALAAGFILLWAVSGPLFHFSDTWQLVVNTSTTIITFLMVFLIQHTQNRDSLAIQIKLAELILVAKGAENEIATAEERSEEYLQNLRNAYRSRLKK